MLLLKAGIGTGMIGNQERLNERKHGVTQAHASLQKERLFIGLWRVSRALYTWKKRSKLFIYLGIDQAVPITALL
jgi:hypothetical protein